MNINNMLINGQIYDFIYLGADLNDIKEIVKDQFLIIDEINVMKVVKCKEFQLHFVNNKLTMFFILPENHSKFHLLIDKEKIFLDELKMSSFIEILDKFKLDWYFNQEFCVEQMLSIIANEKVQTIFTFSDEMKGKVSSFGSIVQLDLL